jgi:hypothetical protein
VKTAQSVLGHTDARVTLDLYAQVVTEQQQAAADATATRFLDPTPRDERGVEALKDGQADSAETTERACEQALSWVSGGGDLNSRPLRPEACPCGRARAETDNAAGQPHMSDGGDTQRSERFAGRTRGATL